MANFISFPSAEELNRRLAQRIVAALQQGIAEKGQAKPGRFRRQNAAWAV